MLNPSITKDITPGIWLLNSSIFNKNNTADTASTSSVVIDCYLINFDFIYKRICDGKFQKTCDYNIDIKTGHTFENSIIKNNILAGYKTGAILTNNVTKSGYAEVQPD